MSGQLPLIASSSVGMSQYLPASGPLQLRPWFGLPDLDDVRALGKTMAPLSVTYIAKVHNLSTIKALTIDITGHVCPRTHSHSGRDISVILLCSTPNSNAHSLSLLCILHSLGECPRTAVTL